MRRVAEVVGLVAVVGEREERRAGGGDGGVAEGAEGWSAEEGGHCGFTGELVWE